MLYELKPTNPESILEVSERVGVSGKRFDDDGPLVLAKTISNKANARYFVKFNTYGAEAGHIVNPWSALDYSDIQNFTNAVNPRTGKRQHEYREVSREIYELYVKYLSSQSHIHYHQAERLAVEDGY